MASEQNDLQNRVERLEALVGLLISGVEHDPAVCGGAARIARTRIPVWTIESMRRQGMRDAEILAAFPTLRAADLVAAGTYAALHTDEINADIARQGAAMQADA
ncbi:MAG: DUF433 domain-containing protein [Planctomycetota bacterium]